MDLRSSSFDGSSFDGRDLFGFLAEGSQFDSGVGVPYDISADFAGADGQPIPPFFDSFYGLSDAPHQEQPIDETELVSLTYLGYVFAKRIVTVRKATDPSYPLPFSFPGDVCLLSFSSFFFFSLFPLSLSTALMLFRFVIHVFCCC